MQRTILRQRRLVCCLLLVILGLPIGGVQAQSVRPFAHVTAATAAGLPQPGSVQAFLNQQPGVLKQYRDGKYSAAQIIEGYAAYYSLNPPILLTLLELEPKLLSNPNPDQATLDRPFGAAGPAGFGAQMDWAIRELRASSGVYTQDPVVQFSDGTRLALSRQQDAALLAVQRFLATGRTQPAWQTLVDGYLPLFKRYFGDVPLAPTPTTTPRATTGFLDLPWLPGTRVIHSSFFDHVYPTVDQGGDSNDFILDYQGRSNLSYNSHDGHDYYFPDQPIGTLILAAAPGTAFAFTARGNGVVIRHSGPYAGYETVYWHLDQFDIKFQDKIDNQIGVPIEAGEILGTSGKTGFTTGGAHLHFEVRHNGLQVDPYGWYGEGPDPCAAWSKCEASVWLWRDSLRGTFDFSPPDAPALPDKTPPTGMLSVRRPTDPSLLVHFDQHPVQSLGAGFPQISQPEGAALRYSEGVFGQAVTVPSGVDLTYPISGNLSLDQGTLTLWANLPANYPANKTKRHYLVAASANAGDSTASIYTDTLTLRHQLRDDGVAEWNFWTVDSLGQRHDLVASDRLQPGWHHFALSWNAAAKTKRLFIDGVLAAESTDATLPTTVGSRLQIGRWATGFGESGAAIDELAVFERVLPPSAITALTAKQDLGRGVIGPLASSPTITDTSVTLDTNAIDESGGIVAVQIRRDNEPWSNSLPYYDSYHWSITPTLGLHTFAVRYVDRANNATIVTTTLRLAVPPRVITKVIDTTPYRTTLAFSLTMGLEPLHVQVSPTPKFSGATWEPLGATKVWQWPWPGAPQRVYVRFRDATGLISEPSMLGNQVRRQWVPLLLQ